MVTTHPVLVNYLDKIQTNNRQNEYYLTDIINMLATDGRSIKSMQAENQEEIFGINDKKQLAYLERYYQKQLANNLMEQGLTLLDPTRFDLRGNLTIAQNIVIDINVIIEGSVSIDENTNIQANNYIKNAIIGKNVIIKPNCVIEDAIIEDNCIIGPFARIRPNTHLQQGSHVGNFVELKNTKLGKNSKAGHLSYLGDAIIGDKVNIGAGTITCNYDGVNKHLTIIEDQAFIGSNTSLVAPVTIGKEAVIGAGSVITANACEKKLTLARSKQITLDNWQRKLEKH
jgi:bifunctional UDP-N-acetylglucosamine pyrophosphorylase/glucosamine-1-phosphate N-acetyltransferase